MPKSGVYKRDPNGLVSNKDKGFEFEFQAKPSSCSIKLL
jgi:hypothetical protein